MENELYKVTYINGTIEMDIDGIPYLIEIPYAMPGENMVIKEKNSGKVVYRESAYIVLEYEQAFCAGLAALVLNAVLDYREIKRL